jgi:hypothetical protein
MATIRGNPVAWDDFYKTARWQRLRKFQLIQHPLCKFCLQRGIVTRANVVDHVTPHRGDWTDFVTGDLQLLCELGALERTPRARRKSSYVQNEGASQSASSFLLMIRRKIIAQMMIGSETRPIKAKFRKASSL